jgi:hypothetical protein
MPSHIDLASLAMPYIDVRGEGAEAALGNIDRFVHEIERLPAPGALGLRGLVIAAPQPSDGLALSLAPSGIMLCVGHTTDPLPLLLNRFKQQLDLIRAADRQGVSQAALVRTEIATSASVGSSSPIRPPRTDSPYAQYPPGFNQAAFDERLRQLQQPWRDEDAWKFDT